MTEIAGSGSESGSTPKCNASPTLVGTLIVVHVGIPTCITFNVLFAIFVVNFRGFKISLVILALLACRLTACAAYIGIGGMKIENEPRH